jgi:NADPH:quinone reductase-like Zn-dependent oxidoreductase
MKAVRIHQYGGPEVLTYEEAPMPTVGERDVLIRVHAASVNPVDWKIREGYLHGFLHHSLPLVLGWDVSGVVEQVGAAVTEFQPGDAVFSRPDISRDGSYAEYVAVDADLVAFKPNSIDHIHAAAVPLAAMTAWQSLFDAANLTAGQRVLIHAAAGGVGSFAVQLAKWKGAYVIGTASDRNLELIKSLGVDEAIDYRATPFETVVKDMDVVYDTVGGEVQQKSWQVLKPGGILVGIVDQPDEAAAAAHNARAAYVFLQPNAAQLTEIAGLIDAGVITAIVENVFPLSEARQAHELSQTGRVRGKIVFQVT